MERGNFSITNRQELFDNIAPPNKPTLGQLLVLGQTGWTYETYPPGGNPFDQDLDTFDSPSFVDLTLTGSLTTNTIKSSSLSVKSTAGNINDRLYLKAKGTSAISDIYTQNTVSSTYGLINMFNSSDTAFLAKNDVFIKGVLVLKNLNTTTTHTPIVWDDSSNLCQLEPTLLTANRLIRLPDKNGNIAITGTAEQFTSVEVSSLLIDNGSSATITAPVLAGSIALQLPSITGTLALTSDIPAATPLWHTIHVETNGNDGTGDGTAYKPFLTIAHALSIVTGSSVNRYLISVGPGIFDTFALKPWTFVSGSGQNSTLVSPAADITLSNWATFNDAQASIENMTIDGGVGNIVFNISAAALTSSLVSIYNTYVGGSITFTGADENSRFSLRNVGSNNITNTNCSVSYENITALDITSSTSIANTIIEHIDCRASNVVYQTTGAGSYAFIAKAFSVQQSLTLDGPAASMFMILDNSGLPSIANITYLNGANATIFDRVSDAFSVGLTQGVPGDWTTNPNNVQDGLNELAARPVPNQALNTTSDVVFSTVASGIYKIGAVNVLRNIATDNVFVGASGNGTTTGSNNFGVNSAALDLLTTGQYNVGIGAASLGRILTGSQCICVGEATGYNYTGAESNNICIGHEVRGTTAESNKCRIGNTSITDNFFNGNMVITAGKYKIAADEVLAYDTTLSNLMLGPLHAAAPTAQFCNGVGKNTFLGLTTGSGSNAIGYDSLRSLTTGQINTGVGDSSLRTLTTGTHNTGIGGASLYNLATGSQNTCLGYNSGVLYNAAESNNICIGYAVNGTAGESNKVRIGNSSITDNFFYGKINIGTAEKLSSTTLNATAVFPTTAGTLALTNELHVTYLADPTMIAAEQTCNSDYIVMKEACVITKFDVIMTMGGANSYNIQIKILENGSPVVNSGNISVGVGGPTRRSFSFTPYTTSTSPYYQFQVYSVDGALAGGDSLTVFAGVSY